MNLPEKNENLSDVLSYSEVEYMMHFEINRIESFKDWPFDESCLCTPKSLAMAGFYHIPTSECPDAVRCFHCFKELDGWEPDDDPMSEHKKHSPMCAFLTMKKPLMQLSVEEFLQFEAKRQENKLTKVYHLKMKEMETYAAEVRKKLSALK